jgi:hypothetical protein
MDLYEGIILKSILEKLDEVVRSGFIWLRIEISGGLSYEFDIELWFP